MFCEFMPCHKKEGLRKHVRGDTGEAGLGMSKNTPTNICPHPRHPRHPRTIWSGGSSFRYFLFFSTKMSTSQPSPHHFPAFGFSRVPRLPPNASPGPGLRIVRQARALRVHHEDTGAGTQQAKAPLLRTGAESVFFLLQVCFGGVLARLRAQKGGRQPTSPLGGAGLRPQSFQLLGRKNLFYFPLLVLKGIYDYWNYDYLFLGGSSCWEKNGDRLRGGPGRP